MALPKALRLSSTALGKADDEHYRALVIEKAHLPAPENQCGSKRFVVERMAPVGINADVAGIVHAPAPGDTRPGFVTVRFVAQLLTTRLHLRSRHKPRGSPPRAATTPPKWCFR